MSSSNLIDKLLVTKLNAGWHAFEQVSVREAITMLCSETNGEKPGYVMDFETIKDDNDDIILKYTNPVSFDEWIKLPVRENDLSIQTSRGPIRCPLVIVCANYSKIPLISPKLGKDAILKRDGYTCQYSGRKLSRGEVNIDHVLARDRGGKDTWENMVACDKEINFKKGNRTNEEMGLRLIRKPVAPKSTVKVIRPQDLPAETRDQVMPFVMR